MELIDLIIRSKQGDKKALEKIIIDFTPLVNKLSFKYFIKGYGSDDLKQIGFLSLIKAVNMYNVEGGKSPVAYIKNSIENNYFYEIRKNSKGNYIISLDKEGEDGLKIIDYIPSDEDIEEDYLLREVKGNIRGEICKLTESEVKILEYAYGRKGLKAYSIELGVSYYKLRKRKEEILCKLRANMK